MNLYQDFRKEIKEMNAVSLWAFIGTLILFLVIILGIVYAFT
jgi:hypothetical protein